MFKLEELERHQVDFFYDLGWTVQPGAANQK